MKNIRNAIVALCATMLFCICLCYVILKMYEQNYSDGWFNEHGAECFVCLFFAVAISAMFAGHSLMRIYIKYGWKDIYKLPEHTESRIFVAFITKERCFYNGIYDPEKELFNTYDGLTFRKNEIISWCNDRHIDYMIKYVEYPTDEIYDRNS